MNSTSDRPATADDGSGWIVTPGDVALGAVVTGANLTCLDQSGRTRMLELLYEHLVLSFQEQHLTGHDHVRIGHMVGHPYVHPFLTAINDHPEILAVLKEANDELPFGGGGDTLFANQYLAFEPYTFTQDSTRVILIRRPCILWSEPIRQPDGRRSTSTPRLYEPGHRALRHERLSGPAAFAPSRHLA